MTDQRQDSTPHYLIRFFRYSPHLPKHLHVAAQPFHSLAVRLDASLPESSEKSMALRKLLEAKDCAVRAAIQKAEGAS